MKNLNLEELKIESFCTSLGKNLKQTVNGGTDHSGSDCYVCNKPSFEPCDGNSVITCEDAGGCA